MTRSLADTTRAFAAMDLALADTTIGLYDAKYTDHVWRPITAIRAGVPGTAADPNWNPLTPTAADPSYPGAHSALSAAAATALGAVWGDRQSVAVTSTADPGVTRSFTEPERGRRRGGSQPHLGGPAHAHRRPGGTAARPRGGGRRAGVPAGGPRLVSRGSHDRVAARGVGGAVAA